MPNPERRRRCNKINECLHVFCFIIQCSVTPDAPTTGLQTDTVTRLVMLNRVDLMRVIAV